MARDRFTETCLVCKGNFWSSKQKPVNCLVNDSECFVFHTDNLFRLLFPFFSVSFTFTGREGRFWLVEQMRNKDKNCSSLIM